MQERVFEYHHRITYAECTLGNHVYYARYLDILEAARGAWFRSVGRTFQEWQDHGYLFPVLECHVRYLAPARYDEPVVVGVWVTQMDRVRLAFGHRLLGPENRELLRATTHHVCTSLQEKPRRLPSELVTLLKPFLRSEG